MEHADVVLLCETIKQAAEGICWVLFACAIVRAIFNK